MHFGTFDLLSSLCSRLWWSDSWWTPTLYCKSTCSAPVMSSRMGEECHMSSGKCFNYATFLAHFGEFY